MSSFWIGFSVGIAVATVPWGWQVNRLMQRQKDLYNELRETDSDG